MNVFTFAGRPDVRKFCEQHPKLTTLALQIEDAGQTVMDAAEHPKPGKTAIDPVEAFDHSMKVVPHNHSDVPHAAELVELAHQAFVEDLCHTAPNPTVAAQKQEARELLEQGLLDRCINILAPEARGEVLSEVLLERKDVNLFLSCLQNADETRPFLEQPLIEAAVFQHQATGCLSSLTDSHKALIVKLTIIDHQAAVTELIQHLSAGTVPQTVW